MKESALRTESQNWNCIIFNARLLNDAKWKHTLALTVLPFEIVCIYAHHLKPFWNHDIFNRIIFVIYIFFLKHQLPPNSAILQLCPSHLYKYIQVYSRDYWCCWFHRRFRKIKISAVAHKHPKWLLSDVSFIMQKFSQRITPGDSRRKNKYKNPPQKIREIKSTKSTQMDEYEQNCTMQCV